MRNSPVQAASRDQAVRSRVHPAIPTIALGLLFIVLATLNCGGYQYGASDQAFYIPAILTHLHPDFFPRDRALIGAEDSLMVFTRGMAGLSRTTGLSLPALCLAGYVLGLAALFGGLHALGRTMYRSRWSVAALTIAWTLRHRISRTGANTVEGYLHPRMLAFAAGLAGVVAILRGRPWIAAAFVIVSAVVHPTTAVWFGIWIGVATIVSDVRHRRAWLAAAGAVAAAAALFLWLGPFRTRFVRIDDEWLSVLAVKDYLFPTAWPPFAWVTNLGYAAIVAGTYLYRRRNGFAVAREAGLVAGLLALVAVFLASLPFVALRVAFIVQIQVSRIFWMADLVATVYVIWLLVEAPWRARWRFWAAYAGRVVLACLMVFALARGIYVTGVEHAGRPAVGYDLPRTPWNDAMAWLRANTASDAYVLADPGHAWRYGTSVRVAAERDVFLEDVKDASIAMYSREAAHRVAERIGVTRSFQQMDADEARTLAARYGFDYLATDRALDLPLAYRNTAFNVYRLREGR